MNWKLISKAGAIFIVLNFLYMMRAYGISVILNPSGSPLFIWTETILGFLAIIFALPPLIYFGWIKNK